MEIQVDSSVIKGSLESKHVIYTVATWTRLNVHEALNCTSDYVQFKMSNPSDGLSTGRECTRKKPSTVPFRNNLFLQLSYSYLDTLSFTCSENLQNVPAKRLAGWSGCFFPFILTCFRKVVYFISIFTTACDKSCVNPFQSSVAFHIKTSHLICTVNQMNGFYMKCNPGLKWVKQSFLAKNLTLLLPS